MDVHTSLLRWYAQHGRHDLPWRHTRDAYKILISEIMLQQTQVPRVIPKYETFLRAYPTIHALANAPRSDVLAHWQGLGYNSRAARLHALARLIVDEHHGQLPRSEEALRKLPGIGPYTAGAIVIFAHDVPAHSVDVNVARVVRRLCYTQRMRPTQQHVAQKAYDLLLTSKRAHDWHSAIMDLGSAICTARAPRCDTCPVRSECKSRGERADEKKLAKTEKFHRSNRWWRGQIIKHALRKMQTETLLLRSIISMPQEEDRDKFATALASLERDGMILRKRKTIKIV